MSEGLSELSPMGDVERQLEGLPERVFEVGESIIREDEPLDALLFLHSGTATVSKGGVEIQKVSVPGAVFGEMSFLLEKAPMATVSAHTRCVMKVATDRHGFINANPEMALYIARILAARLDSVVRYLVDIKGQFPEHVNHFGMMDEILDAIINKHPRKIEKDLRQRDLVDD